MAALPRKTQILAYSRYASDLRFSRALPSRFLNGLEKRTVPAVCYAEQERLRPLPLAA